MIRKPVLLLFLLINVSTIKAQTIADTLELAYSNFDKKDYRAAADYFDHFLSQVAAKREDYYLAGACKAQLSDVSAAIEYLDKAAKSKLDYYMALSDPLFKSAHTDILKRIDKIEEFDKVYASYKQPGSSSERNKLLYLADSVYQHLSAQKVPEQKLMSLAYGFSYRDDFRYFYYMDKAVINTVMENKREELGKSISAGIQRRYKTLAGTALDSLLKINSFAYYYTVEKYKKRDTAGFSMPRIPFEAYMKILGIREYTSMVNELIYDKRYKLAFQLLYAGLATGKLNLEDILKSKRILGFFNQPVGKSFLAMLLSEQVIPSIENADRIIVSSSYENFSSKRKRHNHLKISNFNAYLPSHKAYLIKNKIYDDSEDNIDEHQVIVSDHFQSGLTEDELKAIIDTNGNVREAEKGYQRFFKPYDEVVMIKNTGRGKYGMVPGAYYRQNVENIPFILAVKNGKVRKSIIPSVRREHFKPLILAALPHFLKDKIRREDVRYLVYNYGYEPVELFVMSHLKEVNKEELPDFMELVNTLKIGHTRILDFVVETLSNYKKYVDKDNEKVSNHIFNLLNRTALRYVQHLDGRSSVVKLFDKNKRISESSREDWDKASKQLSLWWEDYKKENPFLLPPMVKHKIEKINDIPQEYKSIFLNGEMEPMFYNPKEHEIYKNEKTNKVEVESTAVEAEEEEVYIAHHDTEATMSISKNWDINGKIISDWGYIFIPTAKDKADELLTIPNLTEEEFTKLKEAYSNLGLKRRGHQYFGNYEKSFDRFYPYRFKNKLLVFWFNNVTLHAAYLDNEEQLTGRQVILHQQLVQKAEDKDLNYKEIPKNLNSLKFKTVGDKLLLLGNFETKKIEGKKSSSGSGIYLKLLDTDLRVIKEEKLQTGDNINLGKKPVTEIEVAGDYIYILARADDDDKSLYCATFNKNLEKVTPLYKLNSLEDETNRNFTLLKNGAKMFVVYPVNRNGDELIAVNELHAKGVAGQTAYICLLDGYVNSIKGGATIKEGVIYVSEHSFKTNQILKIKVPMKELGN